MNNSEKKTIQVFEKNWGSTVLSGGFTQLPNDLIRGTKQLKLNVYDLAVLEHIISVGTGFASAKTIADAQDIAIGTVRKSFRKLRDLGYVRFILYEGEANRFDLKGLTVAVRKVASNRQRDTYEKSMGIVVLDNTPTSETGSNKELLNTNKDKRGGFGYKDFQEMLKAQKNKPKPP